MWRYNADMSLSVGIVGLPNVGKSTLFNALLGKQQALAANYPFATVEPNVGVVPVPDERLEKLAKVVGTERIVPATVTFNDIAGLVKGAAKGEGLGNKFLANIREVDLVCHVLRAFEDDDVVRAGAVSPEDDYAVVEAELIMKDLETVERQLSVARKQTAEIREWAEVLFNHLNEGKPARLLKMSDKQREWVGEMFLLTMKDEVAVVNIGENQMDKVTEVEVEVEAKLKIPVVALSARVEAEVAELGREEARLYLAELGVSQSGLDRLVSLAYGKLNLISFLTAGEKEVRAWTIERGSKAPEAAGVIHSDFEKKFIKAKVCSYDDFIEYQGWKGVAEEGKMRMEGREYEMKEGDVVEFMIGQ